MSEVREARGFGRRLPLYHSLAPRTMLPFVQRKWDRILAERQALWAEAYDRGWSDRERERGYR
jgi:hypothetical protein